MPPELHPKATGLPKNRLDTQAPVFVPLSVYLESLGNSADDILKCFRILSMNSVVLEIGCGAGETALAIAAANPDMGVIATDKYDFSPQDASTSHYCRTALRWQKKTLAAQAAMLDNLVLLRAEVDMFLFLPEQSISSLLMVNPEPAIGRKVLEFLAAYRLESKIKPGDRQVAIKPFSREIGVMACGGFEFDHGEDWSRGLGFLFESPYTFTKADPVLWSVNIGGLSPYSKNSTQQDVYVCNSLYDTALGSLPQRFRQDSLRI